MRGMGGLIGECVYEFWVLGDGEWNKVGMLPFPLVPAVGHAG